MRQQPDHRDPGAERDARGEQRQQHREERPEHDKQHNGRGDEPVHQACGVALRPAVARDLALDGELTPPPDAALTVLTSSFALAPETLLAPML